MKYSRRALNLVLIFTLSACCLAKDPKSAQAPPISKETKMAITRLLSYEFVWTRKPFPMGMDGITIKPDGQILPDGPGLKMVVESKGEAAKAGERVQITNVVFKGNEIRMEINGGGKKKTKWYQHIQVGVGDVNAQAPQNDPAPKGTYLSLQFKDYVPEVTLDDLKKRMEPVIDFSVKSAAQAYVDTLPPIVRTAIGEHRALVGMNKEMVTEAMGRPPQRIRDKDEQNRNYEEWMYGEPPADVQFIRFVGDECVQVKIMKVDGEKIVRTQREVTLDDPAVAAAAQQDKPAPPRPANAPTLRRPGEEAPENQPGLGTTRAPMPRPTPTSTDPPKLVDGAGSR
jgi:hypothetical protein